MFKNEAGVKPLEYKILVKPDKVMTASSGGIQLPDHVIERDQLAQVKGTLVSAGDAAFGNPFTESEKALLQPGARVYFNKYAGIVLIGADDEEYRLMADKEIAGFIESEMAVPVAHGRNRSGLDAA
jgi:co-chaperonin GroES (HSP10)